MKALDTLELTHRITRRTLDGILPDKYCLALLAMIMTLLLDLSLPLLAISSP